MELNDLRTHPRHEVGPDFTMLFSSTWRTFVGARIRNLSLGGCCVQLPRFEAGALFQGALLSPMHLSHSELPKHRLEGRVAWVEGPKDGNGEGHTLVGIQFLNPHERFTKALEGYLQRGQRESSASR